MRPAQGTSASCQKAAPAITTALFAAFVTVTIGITVPVPAQRERGPPQPRRRPDRDLGELLRCRHPACAPPSKDPTPTGCAIPR